MIKRMDNRLGTEEGVDLDSILNLGCDESHVGKRGRRGGLPRKEELLANTFDTECRRDPPQPPIVKESLARVHSETDMMKHFRFEGSLMDLGSPNGSFRGN